VTTSARFPADFLWGVATSSQQIEGAVAEGGRGESIWDRFAAGPGNIEDGSDASVACDHYHRWRGDVELMRRLGVGAYRFSVAWPRVLPTGRGAVNAAGLDFYDALTDALLAAGIRPFLTLHHWDLPQRLQDEGGWGDRDIVDAFVGYAAAVAERLGDRVKHWVTHNEPWCVATLGHEQGAHAPGHRDPAEALRVAHHLLLSHGLAVREIRRRVAGAEVGIVLNLTPASPAAPGRDDDAARQFDGFFNRWYLDPVFRGRYPVDAVEDRVRWGHLEGPELPFVRSGDLRTIAAPLDFLGVNYYSRVVVRSGRDGRPEPIPGAPREELTDMEWEVYPEGLHRLLLRLRDEYSPRAIHITENGAAYADGPDETGRVADERRIRYHLGHLLAAHAALSEGVPLRGYFAWSLLDNFEWGHGYTKRFGLHWVDYRTQARVPKDSARWYRRVATSGVVEEAVPDPDLGRVPR
jgi:beta-glucosidase